MSGEMGDRGGETGDRYRFVREIAHGAIGVVWRATDASTGTPVAVKVIRPDAAAQPDLVAAFAAEAEILDGLSHPGVVRQLGTTVYDGRRALVLEFIEGEDLRRRLRRDGPVPPAVATDVVAQVADALAYLHDRGVVHGDIKPANLLIPADGSRARLIDFGAARRIGHRQPWATQATPEYVAPEVVAGAPPTPAADVYALGIVLFELVCGRSPYRGGPPTQVLGRHGRCMPVPPPGLPSILWAVIEDCLSVDPARRPGAARVGARLRGADPALDGLAALSALVADEVTWWPRAERAASAAIRVGPAAVTWTPLPAPVSPHSGYAGRMAAVPVGGPAAAVPVGGLAAVPVGRLAAAPVGRLAAAAPAGRLAAAAPAGRRAALRRSRRGGRRVGPLAAALVPVGLLTAAALAVAVLASDHGGRNPAGSQWGVPPAPSASAGTSATGDPAGTPATEDPAGTRAAGDPAGTRAAGDPAGTSAAGERAGAASTGAVSSSAPPASGGPAAAAGGTSGQAGGNSPDHGTDQDEPDTGWLPGIGESMPTAPPMP